MNFSKNMKRKIDEYGWWVFVGLCIGFTPYAFYLADLERGYISGIGGEVFILLIPLVVWIIKNSIVDMKRIIKGVFENE